MDDAVPNGILGKQLILTTATVTIKMTPGPFTFRPQKQQEINTDVPMEVTWVGCARNLSDKIN